MIDCHSHILPAIDDGAGDLSQAVNMLGLACRDGVTTQILTPHIHPDHFANTCADVRREFDAFVVNIADCNIPVTLRLAAEFRLCPQLLDTVQRDDMLWLGSWEGRRALLLELPHNAVPVGSVNVIRWLVRREIQPIIVHPERNRELQLKPALIRDFVDNGCLVQVTAGSLLGQFGRAAKDCAEDLLRSGLVSFLASDCHNLRYRPPNLAAGVAQAQRIIGADAAMRLVTEFPQRLFERRQEAA